MIIRESTESDMNDVLMVETRAFGEDDEANLVNNLLNDPSAKPLLSLLAFKDEKPVGHILFTKATLSNDPTAISLLAPLAVIPEEQKQGIGAKLIEEGLKELSQSGIALVFVLGHPEYYPRCGFKPAGIQGFDTPYPIPDKNADAWMVLPLRPGIIDSAKGKVIPADALNKPQLWRE